MTYEVLALLTAPIFTLAGVIFSTVWSSLRYAKETAEEKERYKGIVIEKIHNSSRYFDNEIEMYKRLNVICAEIYEDMCCIFPVRLRKYISKEHTTDLSKVCADVEKFEIEINVNTPFIGRNVAIGYRSCLSVAEDFIECTDQYLLIDEECMGKEAKEERRIRAYNQILEYKKIWDRLVLDLKEYLSDVGTNLDSADISISKQYTV